MQRTRFLLAVFVAAGIAVFGNLPRIVAEDPPKKEDAKKENRGTLWIGDKSYKLEHIVAYETKFFDIKQIVVVMAEKPMSIAKLKEELRKSPDVSFYPDGCHARMTFDLPGKEFTNLNIATGSGAFVIGGSVRAKKEVAIKDGKVRGKVSFAEKPKDKSERAYRLEVVFDTKIMTAKD